MLLSLVARKRININLVISVALVISLIATPLLAGEYVASAQLELNFRRVLVDSRMTIQLTNFIYECDLRNDIGNLSFVRDVKTIDLREEKSIIINLNSETLYPVYNDSRSILLLGLDIDEWSGEISFINGKWPVRNDELAISIDMASRFNLEIGDKIKISSPWGNFNKSYLVTGIFNVTGLLFKVLYKEDLIHRDVPIKVRNETVNYWGIMLFTKNELTSGSGLSSVYSGFPIFLIWVNRGEIFNPWVPSEMKKKLKSFDDQILLKVINYTPLVTVRYINYLSIAIDDYANWPSAFKLQLTYAILPGFLVGSFLAVIIGWTYVNERRHEISLFKIRGVTGRQLIILMVYEFILISVLGSVLGFLITEALTYLTSLILFQDYLEVYSISKILSDNMLNYFKLSVIYGVVFGFLSVIPATTQALKTTILEGLNPYLEKIEKEPQPTYSFIAVFAGIYALIESFSGLYILRNIALKLMNANTALIQITGIIIFVIDVIAIGTGSFMLAYGLSRIISYYAIKLHGLLERLSKFFSNSFATIAMKHFARRPARTARLIFITALIISFMLSAEMNASSNINEITGLVKLVVGSSYRIDVFSGPNDVLFWEQNLTIEIRNISAGMETVTVYYLYKPIKMSLPYARIIAVDPDYFDIAFISNDMLHGVGLQDVKEKFMNGSNVILGISARDEFGFKIGDVIKLRFSYLGEREEIDFKVIGFMDFIPGLLNDIYGAQKTDQILMLVNKNMLLKYLTKPKTILIKSPGGISDDLIMNKLSRIFMKYSLFVYIYSFKKVSDYVLKESITGIMINIYRSQFFQLSVITAFSIYIILLSEYRARKREMALMLSRGVSRKQLYSIAKTEAFIIILAAFLTGFLISWGFSLSLLEMFSYGLSGSLKTIPGHGVIISMDIIVFLISELIIVYLSAVLAMRSSLKIDLPKEIRIHR